MTLNKNNKTFSQKKSFSVLNEPPPNTIEYTKTFLANCFIFFYFFKYMNNVFFLLFF